MRRIILAVAALGVVAALGATVYFFRLTAEVNVADTPPVAPTIDLGAGDEEPSSAPSSLPTPTETSRPAGTTPTAPPEPTVADSTGTAGTAAPESTGVPADAPAVPTRAPARVYRIVPERSRASYRVRETFLEDQTVAVAEGSTDAVAGEILVDRANPERSRFGQIVVDISQLESDEERRDNAIRRQWLESATYPRVTFENARLTGLPERVVDGEQFSFRMTGDMTLHGTTRQQAWDVTATLDGDTLRGEATTRIEMTRYGVEPPNIAGFVAVEDEVALTLEFVATARE